MKDDEKDELRSSLDELLRHDLPDEVPGLEEEHDLKPVKKEYNTGIEKAKNKAKGVIDNLLRFYLSEEIIAEHEYIQAKSELDNFALSSLINQMQNSEKAITILMRSIDQEGDTSPRMFEVLSDLQRTMLDIIKSQTMYMVAIEENVKKISRDVDIYHEDTAKVKDGGKDGVKTRGQKNLMKALQESIKENDVTDAESEDEVIDNYVDDIMDDVNIDEEDYDKNEE